MKTEFIIFIILIVLALAYKFKDRITLPSLSGGSVDVWKVINFIGWLVFLIAIPIMFASEFWERFYNFQYFWLVMGILAYAVFMYSYHSYIRWLGAIIVIVILVIANFGDFKTEKENEEVDESGVNFTIENLDNGQTYYAKTSFSKPFEDQLNFQYRITAEYGKGIILSAKNWSSPDTLVGGAKTDGTSEPHQGVVKIVPLK